MPELVLYDHYSREDVHAIFSPDTVFTPQAGTWGLQGVVPIPDRPGDYAVAQFMSRARNVCGAIDDTSGVSGLVVDCVD
jgi:hypothetical protein